MPLSDLLGLGSALGAPLTPDQLAALPYVNLPQQPQQAQPQPQAPPQVQPQPQAQGRPAGSPSKFRNFLGALGDALLVAHGEQPLYQQRVKDQETQSALRNYLTDPNGAIAALMKIDPKTGINLLAANAKAKQEADLAKPDAVRELIAAGIDPSSPEGQSALQAHLGKAPVAGIAEYQYYKQKGGTLPFADFLRIIHPPGGGTFEETGSSPAPSSGGALRYNSKTGGWDPE